MTPFVCALLPKHQGMEDQGKNHAILWGSGTAENGDFRALSPAVRVIAWQLSGKNCLMVIFASLHFAASPGQETMGAKKPCAHGIPTANPFSDHGTTMTRRLAVTVIFEISTFLIQ